MSRWLFKRQSGAVCGGNKHGKHVIPIFRGHFMKSIRKYLLITRQRVCFVPVFLFIHSVWILHAQFYATATYFLISSFFFFLGFISVLFLFFFYSFTLVCPLFDFLHFCFRLATFILAYNQKNHDMKCDIFAP